MEGSSDIGCRHARATGRELSDPAPDNYHDASRATATSPSATSWLTRPAGARLLTSLGTCRTPLLPCGRRWREALPPQPVERRAFHAYPVKTDTHYILVNDAPFRHPPIGRSCAGFWTPASRGAPLAPAAGVQKAPRHEVAGSLGPDGQPALWGFDFRVDYDGGRETGARRPACLDAGRA